MAAKIGKEIQGTTAKLSQLAQRSYSHLITPFMNTEKRIQSQNGKLSSTTDQWRSQSVCTLIHSQYTHTLSQELTYIIKQDIAGLNQQIAALQSFTKHNLSSANGAKQVTEHNNNVVMMLQSKLADTSIGFKDVLEIRTMVNSLLMPTTSILTTSIEHESISRSNRTIHVHKFIPKLNSSLR